MYNTIISKISMLGSINVPVDIRRKYNIKHRQPILVFEEKGNVYIKKLLPEEVLKYQISGSIKGKISKVRKPYQIGIPYYYREKYNLHAGIKIIFSDMGKRIKLIPMDNKYFDKIKKSVTSGKKD
jgi:bifunctional DNA-binding transcriptional regulator/antitoxin component of YhaV-PrlF toxin-antitoxin module